MANLSAAPVRVTIACSGLDHVVRGYETHSRDLCDILGRSSAVEVELVKGSGANPPGPGPHAERALGCIRRDRSPLPRLARLGRRPSAAYEFEAVTFAAPLVRHLRRHRPDVVFIADKPTAIALHAARRLTGGRHRILFSNGGPYDGPFPYADFVQHLTEGARSTAEARGESRDRSVVLPYGFEVAPPLDRTAVPGLRDTLGLPRDPRS